MDVAFKLNNITYDYRKGGVDADGVYQLDSEKKTYTFISPVSAEIAAEVLRLQAEYDSNQYARDRAAAYPSLTDQADMAYWDRQNGTTTLDDAINAVKAAHPKPTGEA